MLKTIVNCYFITSFIQEHNVHMYPETEKRLHKLCPSVSAHIVNGDQIYDGVIETLLNRVDGTPECGMYPEEDEILRSIGLKCDNELKVSPIDPCLATMKVQVHDHDMYRKKTSMDTVHYGLIENLKMLHYMSEQIDIPFVLLHGGLIGWYWNKKLLPWDTDIDISILEPEKYETWLKTHPITSHTLFQKNSVNDKEFQTFYKISDDFVAYIDTKPDHHIESRIMHEPTGIYTDITYLYPKDDVYIMKANKRHLWGGHTYEKRQLLPLQNCSINNVPFHCPYKVEPILQTNYPTFKNKRHPPETRDYEFSADEQCWKKVN